MSALVEVNYAAEGPTDLAVARKLIRLAGGVPGADYSVRQGAAPGKDRLDRRLEAYNAAAQYAPWLILRDADGACAVELCARLLPCPSQGMRLRIVVPAVEAWLMADREGLASFLGIDANRLPSQPEDHNDLKSRLVREAMRSHKRHIKADLVPHPRSGRREGPGYAQQLIEFINESWRPERAARSSPSLRRAMRRLTELIDHFAVD